MHYERIRQESQSEVQILWWYYLFFSERSLIVRSLGDCSSRPIVQRRRVDSLITKMGTRARFSIMGRSSEPESAMSVQQMNHAKVVHVHKIQ